MNAKGLCVLILFLIISNVVNAMIFYYLYYEEWTNSQKIHLIINIHTKGKYKEYV